MIIGNFKKTDDNGFHGVIRTLTLTLDTLFEPVADKKGEKMPDYRIIVGGSQIGAAWRKTSESGTPYLSVNLDDPTLVAPIFCVMVKAGDQPGYSLV